jgi:ribosomal protein S1
MSEDNLNQGAEDTREPVAEAETAQAQAEVEVTPAQTVEPEATTGGVEAVAESAQAAERSEIPEPSAEEAEAVPKAAAPEGAADYERSFPQLERGGVIKGTVVHIDREGVLVDVGAKSEGIIKPGELSRDAAAQAEDVVSVGEEIDVLVLEAESADGSLLLSKKRADFEKAWDRVIEAKETGKTLKAMVTDRVKGGLVVDLGIRGFVPASHVGTGSPKTNLDRYVGQTIPLKVIEVDKERRKVVLSNRQAEEEEKAAKRHETATDLKVGQIRHGVVRRLTTYGAFVDLGGIDGLLHISEMSWTRINNPADVLKEGQEIEVMILKLDLENGRVSLSLREILPDPWRGIEKTYHVGDTVRGTVARIVPFGAFVQVKNGVEGILPNSEISSRRGTRASDVLTQGEEIEVKVIDLRPEERKLTLSLRQARQEEETRRDRKALDDYQSRSERDAPKYTIGDAMKAREEEKDS